LVEKPVSASQRNGRIWSYLLVSGNDQALAIAVDDLMEESEVLLKPLGFPLAGLPGIMGTTIRADGSTQIVLDPTDSAFTKRPGPRKSGPTEARPLGRLLVVDDSPTTRAVLRNVFLAAGYSITTATDGLDALEKLAAQPVDVVISDVEMPRLNGFDLTRQVKSKFGLPVILVTGREREEHRREGMEAGADAYVVKSSFEDRGLLELVEQFI
jgi:two-component system chemotaxis sensor kinase CheA